MGEDVSVRCPNCYSVDTVDTDDKSYECYCCGQENTLYKTNGKVKVINPDDSTDEIIMKQSGGIFSFLHTVSIPDAIKHLNSINPKHKTMVLKALREADITKSVEFKNHNQFYSDMESIFKKNYNLPSKSVFTRLIPYVVLNEHDVVYVCESLIIVLLKQKNEIMILSSMTYDEIYN